MHGPLSYDRGAISALPYLTSIAYVNPIVDAIGALEQKFGAFEQPAQRTRSQVGQHCLDLVWFQSGTELSLFWGLPSSTDQVMLSYLQRRQLSSTERFHLGST
jgi:hypothetical protein